MVFELEMEVNRGETGPRDFDVSKSSHLSKANFTTGKGKCQLTGLNRANNIIIENVLD